MKMFTNQQAPSASVVWWTPLQRALLDFKITIEDDDWHDQIVNADYLQGAISEMQKLQDSVQKLYLLSFVGASVVLAGGLPTSSTLSVFGVEVSANVLSQQAIAAITAGVYSYLVGKLVSFSMSYGIVSLVFSQTYRESWEVFLAKYDASMLHANFYRPKRIGYSSPKRERLAAWGVVLTSLTTLLLHWAVVAFSAYVAFNAALRAGSTLPTIIGGAALIAVLVSGLAYIACTMIPMPYRFPVGQGETNDAHPSTETAKPLVRPPAQ